MGVDSQQTTKTMNHSNFIRNLPKAEIHIHLEGAIQPETVLKLAEGHAMLPKLPSTDVAELKKWFCFADFSHFVVVYMTIQDLLRSAEDFSLVVYENGADMAAQNIRYRELTITPYTHTDFQAKLPIEALLAGLEDGRIRAQRDYGVEMRWVFDVPRNLSFPQRDGRTYDPRPAEKTLAYALQGRDFGVVGFGLGGHEVNAPPEPFAHAFAAAKAAGLLSVPHAGETMGPGSVWGAIRELQADRIGHGVRAIEDPDLLAYLRERQIPLEINPSSNTCLHVYPNMAAHPFRQLDEMGLLVTINSDDPPLFNTNLLQEYAILAETFGYDETALTRIARNAFVASGVEADVKETLLAEFDNK
ncbi:MAG: adenosine deaminase [Chloroflexi bacterium]|nr:adenosine deaminase [Chloroflexota bacterium]